MTKQVQLPHDWKWVKLGEVCEIVSGNTPKGLELISNTGEFQFYKISDMNLVGNEIKMKFSNLKLTTEEIKKLKIKVYPKGTVIFPKRGGAILTNKKRVLSKKASFDLNVMGILPNSIISSNYLFYWIQKLDLRKIYDGSNVPQINNKNIAPLEFPLPSNAIQLAIVSKIEELFSELDKGIENMRTAQQQLKTYRQAVLKWAFEGKLTNENVNEGVLPEGWIMHKLNDIGVWKGGGTPCKANKAFWEKGNILWVSPKDMKSKVIHDTIDKITSDAILNSSTKLINEGSILFVVRSGILRRTLPVAITICDVTINQDLQAFTPKEVVPVYVYWYVQAKNEDIRKDCSKDGTTVESIESSLLKNYLIPICTNAEQNKIVQEIESRLSVADKIEESITQSLQQAEALRQSILKKAFEGKLNNTVL